MNDFGENIWEDFECYALVVVVAVLTWVASQLWLVTR